jgi:hypothetical protein
MKYHLHPLAATVLCLVQTNTQAQFYTPATEFHDPAQRMFVTEATRVLAWQSGVSAAVEATASVDPFGQTSWLVKLKPSGEAKAAPGTTFTLTYSDTSMLEGVGFYREVFQQIIKKLPLKAMAKSETDVILKAYWEGAESAGPSRVQSAMALAKLTAPAPLLRLPRPVFPGFWHMVHCLVWPSNARWMACG